MTERPFALLTQDDCPSCERLKRMLAGPLRGAFTDRIELIHRQSVPDIFAQLVQAHGVQSVPALIHRPSGAVLRRTDGLGEVRQFLGQPGP